MKTYILTFVAILYATISLAQTTIRGRVVDAISGNGLIGASVYLEDFNEVKNLSKIIICTSDEKSDDELEDLCLQRGWDCYRGSLDDIMLSKKHHARGISGSIDFRSYNHCRIKKGSSSY